MCRSRTVVNSPGSLFVPAREIDSAPVTCRRALSLATTPRGACCRFVTFPNDVSQEVWILVCILNREEVTQDERRTETPSRRTGRAHRPGRDRQSGQQQSASEQHEQPR